MFFKKITEGHVIQTFNDSGECIRQAFYAANFSEYEIYDENANSYFPISPCDMPYGGDEYYPFDMEQPNDETI